MRVLAVDTSTARGSVALVEHGRVRAEVNLVTPDQHSRWLQRAVETVVAGLGLSPRELDGLAVAVGPGSFTGLRVGIGTVQGLALATGLPCAGISTLEALASLATGPQGVVVALVDAFRDEVYSAVFDGELRALQPPRVGPVAQLLETLSGAVAVVGDGAERCRAAIRARLPDASFPVEAPFLAVAVARRAAAAFAAGRGVSPKDLRPLYVRGPDIRRS